MKGSTRILLSLAIALSAVAVILGAVAIGLYCSRDTTLYSSAEIGLVQVLGYEREEVFIEDGGNPYHCGNVEDEEFAEAIGELLLGGVYQKTATRTSAKRAGDGALSYVRFKLKDSVGAEHTLAVYTASANSVGFSFDGGKTSWYKSSVGYELYTLLQAKIDETFAQ